MKKLIALVLAVVICLSLCACGGTAQISATDVEDALANCDGKLTIEDASGTVTGFTYLVKSVNADNLMDKDYSRDAILTVLNGDPSKITMGQYDVGRAFLALMNVVLLFEQEGDFNSDAFMETMLGIICDGNTEKYAGWSISAEVDMDNNSMTIYAMSK